METIYLVSLIVGGFFVVLSMLGGEQDSDAEAEGEFEAHAESDLSHDAAGSAGVGFVDLLSIRFLFLFAAFFGLTGTLLQWTGATEPLTAISSILTGLVVGLGGNYFIKTVGYRSVSSDVTSRDLVGRTATVQIPFSAGERGKIQMVAGGRQLSLIAESLDDESDEAFGPGDSVVVVRMHGSIAEVVKPD